VSSAVMQSIDKNSPSTCSIFSLTYESSYLFFK